MQFPQQPITTFQQAIQDAKAVYDHPDSKGSDYETAATALSTAIITYTAIKDQLNEPTAERYNIFLHHGGVSYDGYVVTMHKGTNPQQGNYGAKYLTPTVNVNYNQAFQLTKAEGQNRYVLSFTTDGGQTRWLCDGKVWEPNNTADWIPRRIRTTDTESKALEFEIRFVEMKGETPYYHLINTSVGESVGQNNNNDMYTTNPAKFSFAEAQKACVPVAIAADADFSTCIFPFLPTLPAGVIAFACFDFTKIDNYL